MRQNKAFKFIKVPNVHSVLSLEQGRPLGWTSSWIAMPGINLEVIKVLAFILMVVDHINKYVYHESLPGVFAVGRISFPLFVLVLAYKLAQKGTMDSGALHRMMKRLMMAGCLAEPFFVGLGGLGWGWWPLNVLFALWVMVAMIEAVHSGRTALAIVLFIGGGSVVEFWWPGLLMGLSAWWWFRRGSNFSLFCLIAATASLYLINQNMWAMFALPLFVGMAMWRADPQILRIGNLRHRKFYYFFYPAHLAILLLMQQVI